MRIRKNDQVIVIAGKDKGKKGRVMRVFHKEQTALVEKINYRKKAMRRTQQNRKGGVLEMEGKIHISKLQIVCPRTGKPSRVGYEFLADGTKQRVAKVSGEVLGK